MCFLSKRKVLGLTGLFLLFVLLLLWNWENGSENWAAATNLNSSGQQIALAVPEPNGNWEEYRMEKEKSRSEQRQRLQNIIELGGEDSEAGKRAAVELLELTGYQAREAELENLLLARGYKDLAVWLDSEGVLLILSEKTGREEELRHLAARFAGVEDEKIMLIF